MDDERWLQEFVPNAVRRGILPVSALPCGWTSRLPAEERNAILQQVERSSTLTIPPLGSMTMDWHMAWDHAWPCEGDLSVSDAPPHALAALHFLQSFWYVTRKKCNECKAATLNYSVSKCMS